MHEICTRAGKQVHDHCNHWIDTTQSIQWTSVTPPNLGGGKTEALGVKTTAGTRGTAKTLWAVRGAPTVTPSTDEILPPPPIRRTPDFPVRKFVGQKRLENHGFIGRTTESPRWRSRDLPVPRRALYHWAGPPFGLYRNSQLRCDVTPTSRING